MNAIRGVTLLPSELIEAAERGYIIGRLDAARLGARNRDSA